MKNKLFVFLLLTSLMLSGLASAKETSQALSLQKVKDNVYAIVGPFGNRTSENHGNNSTSGFVITNEGVVLVDSGGSYLGAAEIDRFIKQVTDKPVKIVINSGGQDHRWLGNGYFKERGARIIASKAAVDDQRARLQDQMFMLGNLIGVKGLEGTEAVYADEAFDESKRFTFGGTNFELKMVGIAHTPGDILIWLPDQRVMFSGDVVFIGRMLGVQSYSNSKQWIEAFKTMASFKPDHVIPGHGPATNLSQAKTDTLDYLMFLRGTVGAFMEEGGTITDIGKLDQSRFKHLADYQTLKGRNAQQVFQEMEWE
jgi:glyoxylase-like metal-dependent hydrolase (beta-lactamase superfamily II)